MYALLPRPDRLEARSPDHCSSSSSRKDKGVDETNYIADAIASIRLAISHHDPYEEWSNKTKREARVRFFGFSPTNRATKSTYCLANSSDRAVTAYWRAKSQIRSCTGSGCRPPGSNPPKGEARH